jgi:hypothetical protein
VILSTLLCVKKARTTCSPIVVDFPASRTMSQVNSYCLSITYSVVFCDSNTRQTKAGGKKEEIMGPAKCPPSLGCGQFSSQFCFLLCVHFWACKWQVTVERFKCAVSEASPGVALSLAVSLHLTEKPVFKAHSWLQCKHLAGTSCTRTRHAKAGSLASSQ